MAYEGTDVPVSRSQDGIRNLVMKHEGAGIIFVSQPPKEGFEVLVTIQKEAYHIRVMATCKDQTRDKNGYLRSPSGVKSANEQELRRVWRVLFFHLKAMFEAADSGVIAVEDIILPYIVTPDNRTISEHVKPRLAELRSMNPERILKAGGLK